MNRITFSKTVRKDNRRFSPIRLKLYSIIAMTTLVSPLIHATVQTIPIEANDQSVIEDGSVIWVGQQKARVGMGYGAGKSSVYVLPFRLPELDSAAQINSTSLTINLEAWVNYSKLNNVDLYGLSSWSSSSVVDPNTDFIDGIDPSSFGSGILLQDNFLTPDNINGTSANSQAIVKTSHNFSSFLKELYNSGAKAGDYAFLVLVHDGETKDNYKFYEFTTANRSGLGPYVSLDILSTATNSNSALPPPPPPPPPSITTPSNPLPAQPVASNENEKIDFTAHSNDQTVQENRSTRWVKDNRSRIGNGYNASTKSVHVIPFELPVLEAGETIKSATLTATIQGWTNWQNQLANIDLYGMTTVSDHSAVVPDMHFVDGARPEQNVNAVLLTNNFATASDISSGPTGSNQTVNKVSSNIGSFLQQLYDAGAQAGQYVFLVLTHDKEINKQRYYEVATANNSNSLPTLSVEFSSSDSVTSLLPAEDTSELVAENEVPPQPDSVSSFLPAEENPGPIVQEDLPPEVEQPATHPGDLQPTLWVDGFHVGTEDGSLANPYSTIQEAINAASGGDVIRIKGGTYTESLSFQKRFSPSSPLIIETEPGEKVELSGATALTGWSGPNSAGIYTLETNQVVNDLFVGDTRMPAARWPDVNKGSWPTITGIDKANDTLAITGSLPPITKASYNLGDLQAYIYVEKNNVFDTIYITEAINGSPNKVKLLTSEFNSIENSQPTRLLFVNHPDLISQPGEWAREKLGGGVQRISFKPRKTGDLVNTNTRKLSSGLNFGSKAPSYVTVRGLYIKSFRDKGVNISKGANHITLEDIVIYNVGRKEVWGIGGNGIFIRDSQDIVVKRCVVAMNSKGIGLHSAKNVVVDQCEVAKNDEDGIFARGAGPQKKTNIAGGTVNFQISNSYVHHHLYQGHPDNIQYTLGVYNASVDKVLAMYSGQNFISADTFDSSLKNSIFVGSGAINVIAGKSGYPDENFSVIDNSLLFSRWKPGLSVIAKDSMLSGNILYGLEVSNDINPDGQLFKSDNNLYWPAGTGLSTLWTLLKPYRQEFFTLPSFTAYTGEDKNSNQTNPQLSNIPKMVNLVAGLGVSSNSRLVVLLQKGKDVSKYYAAGNKVEVNGDGVVRTVTSVDNDSITISPALPEAPFRMTLVANWGSNSNLQMDTLPLYGSPAIGAGQNGSDLGSTINIADYQAGDFNGDGIRDIPAYPAEVKYQLDNPNEYTDPFAVLP